MNKLDCIWCAQFLKMGSLLLRSPCHCFCVTEDLRAECCCPGYCCLEAWGQQHRCSLHPLSEDWLFQLHWEVGFVLSHFVSALCHDALTTWCILFQEGHTLGFRPSSVGPRNMDSLADFLPLLRTSTSRQELILARSFLWLFPMLLLYPLSLLFSNREQ